MSRLHLIILVVLTVIFYSCKSDSLLNEAGVAPSLNMTTDPQINVLSGVYTEGKEIIIDNQTEGAIVKYTTDGTNPKISSTAIKGVAPIKLSFTVDTGTEKYVVLKIYASKEGYLDSRIVVIKYKFVKSAGAAASPVFSPETGEFSAPLKVGIKSPVPAGKIVYTTDMSDPKTSATAKVGNSNVKITVDKTMVVKAYITKAGLADSPVVTKVFSLDDGKITVN